MRPAVETNGLDKYLNGAYSEQATKALRRFIELGMQEVTSVDSKKCLRDKRNSWKTEYLRLKCSIASDPATTTWMLNRLAQCYEVEVLERIAENPQTEAHTLSCLATSEQAEVRMAVAENRNTRLATLVALAFDECPDVRFRLAENHNVSNQILQILLDDENPYVSWRARLTLDRLLPPDSSNVPFAA